MNPGGGNRTVRVTVPVADAGLAADRLWQAGASAFEEREVPGAVVLEAGGDSGVAAGRRRRQLARGGGGGGPRRRPRRLAALRPRVRVGERLAVRPPWLPPVGRSSRWWWTRAGHSGRAPIRRPASPSPRWSSGCGPATGSWMWAAAVGSWPWRPWRWGRPLPWAWTSTPRPARRRPPMGSATAQPAASRSRTSSAGATRWWSPTCCSPTSLRSLPPSRVRSSPGRAGGERGARLPAGGGGGGLRPPGVEAPRGRLAGPHPGAVTSSMAVTAEVGMVP